MRTKKWKNYFDQHFWFFRRIWTVRQKKNLLILAEVKNFIHYEKSNESFFFLFLYTNIFFHQLQRNFGSYIRFNCICTNTSGTFRRPLKLHNYVTFFFPEITMCWFFYIKFLQKEWNEFWYAETSTMLYTKHVKISFAFKLRSQWFSE